ncbi:hypothetical protein AcW1_007801 [Taiwanofungus camphoratus]|nr:hypothetical protein AcW2_007142 [Antrodia cinnamomea]KAI0923188.1 hypothetical protein AcV7_005771 [Antrodia cinnamomea]KAI0926787.1 hypothetical protein AcV5_007481 [Antrodia cinnamomea]KAI0953627.1 hypothetical protein AcW1_007801 [Antrodia cinnamomea]
MGQLSLSQARLFGAVYEAILYGINFILMLSMLCLFSQQKNATTVQRIRTGLSCVIFALCTVHLAAVLQGIQLAFFKWTSSDAFFNDRSQPMSLVQAAVYGVATILADGLLIHRLYIIYGYDWTVTILPSASLIATAVTWFLLLHAYRVSQPNTGLYASAIARLAPTTFILTFVTNVIITVMASARILRTMRSVRRLRSSSSSDACSFNGRFLAYTVESGILYPLSLLVTGILYFLKNNGLEVISGSNMQLLCMVPMLLSLQMRLNLSIYDTVRSLRSSAAVTATVDSALHFRRISHMSGLSAIDVDARPPEGDVELGLTPASDSPRSKKLLFPEWKRGTLTRDDSMIALPGSSKMAG